MKHLFKNHSIKKIIYSLDAGSYIHQQKSYKGYPLKTFNYLYDDNTMNDFKVYLNTKFLKCLMTFSNKPECVGENIDLDRPNAWFKEKGNIVRYGGINNWFKANNNQKIKSALSDIAYNAKQIKLGKKISLDDIDIKTDKAKNYIDKTILNFIKAHPETEFILIFPPYSRMHYAWWAQYYLPYFEIHKAVIQYFVQQSKVLNNMQIYGFENENFLDNLTNYKDAKHYHFSINSWMLSQIAQKKNLLNDDNIHHYLEEITEKALNFNIVDIGKKIDNYLNTVSKQ